MFSISLLLLVLFLVQISVHSHTTGFHGVDGEPGATPVFPEITGAFTIEIDFMLKSGALTTYSYMRLYDTCDSDTFDSVVGIGQIGSDPNLMLEIFINVNPYYVRSTTALTEEVVHNVRAGVNSLGQLWIQVDHGTIEYDDIMNDVGDLNQVRTDQFVGSSCFASDDPLYGSILGLTILPDGTPPIGPEANRFKNIPSQVLGPFTVSFWARFDDPAATRNEVLFDLGNGAGTNNIFMAKFLLTNDVAFGILQDGVWTRIFLRDAIVAGENALWHAGVNDSGDMWIQKDGTDTQVSTTELGVFTGEWRHELRTQMFVGTSDFNDANIINGYVIGLQVDSNTDS